MLRRPLVLLVDSDEDTRTILRAYFEHRHFGVVDTADGETAINLARRVRPDLVIGDFPTDVPGHSPLSNALRSSVGTHLPILVVTSWAASQSELKAAEAAGDAVLAKPATPRRVFEEAERLLNRLAPHRSRKPSSP